MALVEFNQSLVFGIEVGFSLSLVNSLNTDVAFDLSLLNNILTSVSFNRTFKLNLNELAKIDFNQSLINHILDDDSGKTYGDFYFLKSHGIT